MYFLHVTLYEMIDCHAGNNGYPVTHFWVHQDDGIYFESKGTHDHFRPQARRATPDRNHNRGRTISPKQEGTSLEETDNAENKVRNWGLFSYKTS